MYKIDSTIFAHYNRRYIHYSLTIHGSMKKTCLILSLFLVLHFSGFAQKFQLNLESCTAHQVKMSEVKLSGKKVLRLVKDPIVAEVDEPTFALINGIEFSDGIIEVEVLSRLLPEAPQFARGFIGLAFRISDDKRKYESIYIRPTNGRADDQIRRNHSTQYYAYPDYKFDRLRKESSEKYESYADMGLNEWIKMRIEVSGEKAKLYLNEGREPVLLVNDLKWGKSQKGSIGLWVEVGTEGFFRNFKIIPSKS